MIGHVDFRELAANALSVVRGLYSRECSHCSVWLDSLIVTALTFSPNYLFFFLD